jgi:hypothetical protein
MIKKIRVLDLCSTIKLFVRRSFLCFPGKQPLTNQLGMPIPPPSSPTIPETTFCPLKKESIFLPIYIGKRINSRLQQLVGCSISFSSHYHPIKHCSESTFSLVSFAGDPLKTHPFFCTSRRSVARTGLPLH